MIIGILKERFEDEMRVALTPYGVESLVRAGAQFVIERGAGDNSRFTDDQYREAGGTVVYSAEEAAARAELLLKVMPPIEQEYELLGENKSLVSFLLLGMRQKGFVDLMLSRGITSIGLELIRGPGNYYPILRLMSEISGQIAALVGSRYLRSDQGGRGILLGGVGGVAPAAFVILGVGASGFATAQAAIGLGAQVILLDSNIDKLREADLYFRKQVTTVLATPENIRRGVKIADVFVGAISIEDEYSEHIVSEEMVKTMKPGAVIIDISINQGGCVETSRPTSIKEPVFEKHGVIHYCVPNMPSMVARSSTYALTNGMLPLLRKIIANGLEETIAQDNYLRCAVVTHKGKPVHQVLNDLYDIPVEPYDCSS